MTSEHIVNPTQAIDDIVVNLQIGRPTLYVGPVGVGKTDAWHAAGKRMASLTGAPYPVLDIRASQLDPTDIAVPMPDNTTGRTKLFLADWLPRRERDGEQGIILFDEYTDASVGVQAALNQLVLEGKLAGGAYDLRRDAGPGWRIGATGNRSGDRAAAGRVSRASGNRFAIMVAGVDAKAWVAWAKANGIAPELIAFVERAIMEGKGEAILHKYPEGNGGDATPFPTPRSIAACSPYLDSALNLSLAQIRRHFIYNVGVDWTESFMVFLRSYRLMPDVALILSDPDHAPVHTDSAVNYALCVTLAARMDRGNIAAIAAYAKRLHPEYRAALWNTAIARTDTLAGPQGKDIAMGEIIMATPEYIAHCVSQSNGD